MTLSPTASLADPSGSGALVAASEWVQGTMLGTVATTVAVIAVASVGLLMLGGRMDVRRGMTVVFGCFVLFGAGSLAAGIMGMARNDVGPPVAADTTAPMPRFTPPQTAPYDPYAGASVRQ